MSALWHTAKRGGQGLDGRCTTSFPQCTHESCTGRILRNTVYEDGPDLCFAHADDRQRTAALLVMKLHKRVDVRGTVLNEHHVQQILNAVRAERFVFRGCTFTGNAPFPGTMLKIETTPERGELTPSVAVDFGQATFEAGADFRKVAFPGRVFFDDMVSAGPLFLDGAHFHDEAWFLRTTMTEGHLAETTFDHLAGFHDVSATTSLSFTGSEFSGRTDFDDVSAPTIDFTDATFSKRAAMTLDGAGVFTGTQFDGGLELRLAWNTGSATLRRTHFAASSTVTTVELPVRFPAHAEGPLRFARVLSLQGTDVEKLSLVSVDLQDCLFAGALKLDKISFSGAITFARFPVHWREPRRKMLGPWGSVERRSCRDLIREDLFWRIKPLASWHELNGDDAMARELWLAAGLPPEQPTPSSSQVPDGPQLASLYRALRKALEDAKNEPGAGDFYYGEMEIRRRSRPFWSADRWLLTVYWALSGYGQRASRAVAALAVLLGMLTVLLTGYGLADTAPIQRITDASRTVTPAAPQVITIDITGQRVTATLPPSSPPVALDVTTVVPTLPPPDQRWTSARAQRAIRTLVTLLAPISTDQRLTTAGAYLVLAGRVLGAFLLGLAVLAIRARVKR